mmetsp:Transcript_58584/g.128660  ORF Transcript_58584/g.128660 Transcript_58584/m.128660 type:complete len:479 (-) Transcript_58584:25-1461(-)
MAPRRNSVKTAALLAGLMAYQAEAGFNFTVVSEPIRLRYGQVHNRMMNAARLPEDVIARYADGSKQFAVSGFDVDMVRIDENGKETKVLLDDHYLHHYILYLGRTDVMDELTRTVHEDEHMARMLTGCHGMTHMGAEMFNDRLRRNSDKYGDGLKVFGSAAGAEYRANPQRFDQPFRMLLTKPEVWSPIFHIINTNKHQTSKLPYSPLLECPCTPQRKIDVKNHTIDGKPPYPPIGCSKEFAATGNPSCQLSTYVGGWRCCEDGVFVIDTDKECSDPQCSEEKEDVVYMKFTFYYEDAEPHARDLEGAACCDVTSVVQGDENIEYDIPKCPAGTPKEKCVHVAESVQPLAYYDTHPVSPSSDYKGSDLVDLAFAAPHLHLAGQSIQLIDDKTGEVMCEVHSSSNNTGGIMYGNGTTAGNENGYLVGLSTCSWSGNTTRRYRRDHPFRSRAVYDATRGHTGVMSLWLMSVSPAVPDFVV